MVKNRFIELLQEKGAREGRRITYAEVKSETGVAESTLSAWAKNRVTKYDVDTLNALCKYFNCPAGPVGLLEYQPEPKQ